MVSLQVLEEKKSRETPPPPRGRWIAKDLLSTNRLEVNAPKEMEERRDRQRKRDMERAKGEELEDRQMEE